MPTFSSHKLNSLTRSFLKCSHFSNTASSISLALLFSATLATTVTATLMSHSAHAANSSIESDNIKVTLQQPKWQFLLENQPLKQTQARIKPNERSFAEKIQPLLAKQDYSAVIKAFTERDIQEDVNADPSNNSAALWQLRGQVQLMQKDYDGAEKSLLQALTEFPNLALAHRSLSMVYMVKKSYKKAQVHLKKSIEFGVEDAQVLGQLSFVNLQLGQAASAISGYQRALFLAPTDKQWQQGLLYALLNSHAFDQAQALLEEMLQSDLENSELWLQRGQLALKQNRLPQAITSLEMALMLGNNDVENLASTAKLHIQAGSPDRAVEIIATHLPSFFGQGKASSTTSTKVDIATVDDISAWLASQQRWQQLTTLLNAVDQYASKQSLPDNYQAKFDVYHAQMDIANNKITNAQKRLKHALDYNPTHGEALLSLAALLKSQDRDEQALQYYIRAQALTDYKERALLGHAQLEIDRQAYEQAIKLLRQVVQMNPERRDVLANIKSLKNIVRNQS
ncbi:tetratricopeptide repeat protein [Colwellia sp. E2M01]|uniref:tetratricopeptide repeat protein n=1 Tax=Colwellia sp. E2M01 TaxID=2841561 RepID=UPI001C094B63|nr:tetratricopeptide repeat protein [Colwellia sp. E2M01]MBU2871696.1 tetratricopeptide repeat protein [Colwellia sp. E2M01]